MKEGERDPDAEREARIDKYTQMLTRTKKGNTGPFLDAVETVQAITAEDMPEDVLTEIGVSIPSHGAPIDPECFEAFALHEKELGKLDHKGQIEALNRALKEYGYDAGNPGTPSLKVEVFETGNQIAIMRITYEDGDTSLWIVPSTKKPNTET